MKNLLLLCLFGAFCGGLWAQPSAKLDATQVIEQVLNTKVFIDYSNVKKTIENQLLALNTKPQISAEDYTTLQNAYGQTKAAFDDFLAMVRQDMLDFQLFEKSANGDQPAITRYLNAYNHGTEVYNRSFQPVYNRVVKTRSLKDWLEPLVLQAFHVFGGLFKGKNPRQDGLINDLLLISKKHFLNRLELKPWENLVRIQPNFPNGGVDHSSTVPPSTAANPGGLSGEMLTTDTLLEAPVMKTLSGSLEFVVAGNPSQSMIFELATRSRNLVVEEANNNAGKVDIPVLQSIKTHPEGTAFQIRVQNTALLYAFALNSDGTCVPIYPFAEAWVRGFQMSKTRNLSVGPLMLQDEAGTTVIPSKNANTGAENFIKISGDSQLEQLCLIVTRSELDLPEITKQIEEMTGKLAERVAALWQSAAHFAALNQAGMKLLNGRIQFDVQDQNKWLLPIVFEIRR